MTNLWLFNIGASLSKKEPTTEPLLDAVDGGAKKPLRLSGVVNLLEIVAEEAGEDVEDKVESRGFR